MSGSVLLPLKAVRMRLSLFSLSVAQTCQFSLFIGPNHLISLASTIHLSALRSDAVQLLTIAFCSPAIRDTRPISLWEMSTSRSGMRNPDWSCNITMSCNCCLFRCITALFLSLVNVISLISLCMSNFLFSWLNIKAGAPKRPLCIPHIPESENIYCHGLKLESVLKQSKWNRC